jgi:NUMOD4 motif/HNH endonuclease
MSQPAEEWRSIAGWPDYQVSSLGRVRSTRPWSRGNRPPRILRPSKLADCGYPYVSLYGDKGRWKVCIHVLVCVAFHGPKPPDKNEVAHADGDPLNNHVSNLRWATWKENNEDKKRHGTYTVGEHNPASKLTEEQERRIRQLGAVGRPYKDMAIEFGITRQTIGAICLGRSWRWLSGTPTTRRRIDHRGATNESASA